MLKENVLQWLQLLQGLGESDVHSFNPAYREVIFIFQTHDIQVTMEQP